MIRYRNIISLIIFVFIASLTNIDPLIAVDASLSNKTDYVITPLRQANTNDAFINNPTIVKSVGYESNVSLEKKYIKAYSFGDGNRRITNLIASYIYYVGSLTHFQQDLIELRRLNI